VAKVLHQNERAIELGVGHRLAFGYVTQSPSTRSDIRRIRSAAEFADCFLGLCRLRCDTCSSEKLTHEGVGRHRRGIVCDKLRALHEALTERNLLFSRTVSQPGCKTITP